MNFWMERSIEKRGSFANMKMAQNVCSVTALVLLGAVFAGVTQGDGNEMTPQVSAATAGNERIAQASLVIPMGVAKIAVAQYKTTIDLNLRSGAGTQYGIINHGPTGTTVTGTGNANGVWYEVKMGNQTGWMSSDYLSKISTPAPSTPVVQYKTTINLNLRSGAGTQYGIITYGPTGTTVTGTGQKNGVWYEVKMGNQTGWMSSDYLTQVSAAPAVPAPVPVTPVTPVAPVPVVSISAVQYKTTINLNLRSGAGTQFSVITYGPTGTIVTGTGKTNGVWYEVKMGNQTGWMSSDYLQAITGPNSIAALQAFAGSKLENSQQLSCLITLWNRESNWNYNAINPTFNPSKPATPANQAFGIPQAAPGSQMASAGADWQTNPHTQIVWGLNYISGRYGNPCTALSHSSLTGWY